MLLLRLLLSKLLPLASCEHQTGNKSTGVARECGSSFLYVERRRKGDCLLGDGIVKRDDGIEVVLANGATAILLLKEHKNTKRLRQNRSLLVNMIQNVYSSFRSYASAGASRFSSTSCSSASS